MLNFSHLLDIHINFYQCIQLNGVRTKNEIWHVIMITNVIWSCATNFDILSNKWLQM
jgi:hypothetical protein